MKFLNNTCLHNIIAKPLHIKIVDSLPKTRSGKIMRRVLKARALGIDQGNLSIFEK
jgi:acetyl-CoA synthetase